jgi:uncharacterized protein YicC (UPF0701 family)
MKKLQTEAERLLERAADGTTSKRAVRQQQRGGQMSKALTGGIVERARSATSRLDQGREELLASLETQLAKRVTIILERLEIPTRSEFDALSRRIDAVEKKLDAAARPVRASSVKKRQRRG